MRVRDCQDLRTSGVVQVPALGVGVGVCLVEEAAGRVVLEDLAGAGVVAGFSVRVLTGHVGEVCTLRVLDDCDDDGLTQWVVRDLVVEVVGAGGGAGLEVDALTVRVTGGDVVNLVDGGRVVKTVTAAVRTRVTTTFCLRSRLCSPCMGAA